MTESTSTYPEVVIDPLDAATFPKVTLTATSDCTHTRPLRVYRSDGNGSWQKLRAAFVPEQQCRSIARLHCEQLTIKWWPVHINHCLNKKKGLISLHLNKISSKIILQNLFRDLYLKTPMSGAKL
jgi:hypothetical protein